MRWIIVCWVLLAIGGDGIAQNVETKVQVQTDLVFAKEGDQELKLDLAIPRGKGPFPVIVCLRGAFWQYGSTKELNGTINELAKRGFVAAAVGYRRPPAHPFPAAIEDCKCAVRWLRANAQQYRLKPNAIGALGLDSGGGHLALLMALTNPTDGLDGKGDLTAEARRQSSQIAAAVSYFGPTDLTSNDWTASSREKLSAFLGGQLTEREQRYRQASPRTYVRPRNDWPTILVFHGTKDETVPFAQSATFVDAVKKAGGPAFLISLEGEGHGWRGDTLIKSIELTIEVLGNSLK